MESFSEELFVDEGSEWSSSESSLLLMSCGLSDDWSMACYLSNITEGNDTERDNPREEARQRESDKDRDKDISDMTLNDMMKAIR
jgi:hypothetical protein